MNKLQLCIVSAIALSVGVACGDTVVFEGEGGGGGETTSSSSSGSGGTTSSSSSSSSSSGTGGSGGVMPPECQVPTNQPAPYAVSFDFINNGPTPLFLAQDCYVQYTVTSCADGYSQALSLRGDCTVDCDAEPDACIACGACPFGGLLVGQGDGIEDLWQGHTYLFGENAVGCYCHKEFNAAAGLYRISVPVFASEEDVQLGNPAWVVEQAFELPAPSGVVTIWLEPSFDSSS